MARFVFLLLVALFFTACEGDPLNNKKKTDQDGEDPDNPNPVTYTVTFNSNGGSTVNSITNVKSGAQINAPVPPTKNNFHYTLDAWYKEAALSNAWNFTADAVTNNITLYAKWKDPRSTNVRYPEYKGLVMAGYQGWFNAPADGANRGWRHYGFNNDTAPIYAAVDFWPDMTEYTATYTAPFKMPDGSDACLYSPYDEESVALHFKWMQEYGIDGVFMQRFVTEINNPSGKNHFNRVLRSALRAAREYERAIGVMYDLSGCQPKDLNLLISDWGELQTMFSLADLEINPTYIYHNNRPLLTIWGVGFNDSRAYTTAQAQSMITTFKSNHNISIMLGIPYWWRTDGGDVKDGPALRTMIENDIDIVMPWAVGRYDNGSYGSGGHAQIIPDDISWCRSKKVDYVPLVFPGFSWGNLKNKKSEYNSIPRSKGDFLWKQMAGAKTKGASSLYVAMFDEIDEGTAIFKCAIEGNVPVWTDPDKRFVGIEKELASDYYLWLAGEAAKWFHGGSGYSAVKPVR